MTGDRRKFVSLSKKEGNVSFQSRSGRIARKGSITLINGKGKAQDALLVDGLKHNLLSVSQICEQGHKVVFNTKECEIRNSTSGKLMTKGVRTPDNIYILNKIQENKCYLKEEHKEEEIDEEEEQEKREPPHTPSNMKYVERYHLEEHIIGDTDEIVQTRRRITTSPKRKVIALLSMIEPETFAEASKDPHWVKAMEEEMSQIEKNKTC
eukprot:PITA_19672